MKLDIKKHPRTHRILLNHMSNFINREYVNGPPHMEVELEEGFEPRIICRMCFNTSYSLDSLPFEEQEAILGYKISENRITLEDDFLSMCKKLSEGNPGALTVLVKCYEESEQIDPYAGMGNLSYPFALDVQGIYGSDIWVLYKDVCSENITRFCTVLRAIQLGDIDIRDVREAMVERDSSIASMELLTKVREHLPEFGKSWK